MHDIVILAGCLGQQEPLAVVDQKYVAFTLTGFSNWKHATGKKGILISHSI